MNYSGIKLSSVLKICCATLFFITNTAVLSFSPIALGQTSQSSVESLTLRYRNKAPQTNTQGIEAQIELVNDGSTAVNYNGLEIQYFFTADGLTPRITTSRANPSGVSLVASYVAGSNSHAAFLIDGDLVIAAGERLSFRFEITSTQNGQYNQSNDASYVASQTNMGTTSVMAVVGNGTGGTDTSSGTDTSGTGTSGTDTGGTDTSGTDTSGTDTSGSDTSGTDTGGTDTGGTDTSGTDTSGTDTSGTDTGGTDTSGGTTTGGSSTGGSADSLTLRYRNKAPQTNTQGIEAQIELVNDGSSAVNYNGLEIRYFFTADGLTPRISTSRANPSGASLATSYVSGSNGYAAFLINKDLVVGAGQKLSFRFEITNTSNGQFNQSNDASYIASQTNMSDTSVMAVVGGSSGGTDTGGTSTGGTDTSGTDTSGTDTGGTSTGGTDTSGTDTSGSDTSGTDTSGSDTSGTDTSGSDTGGTDTSGTDTGGTGTTGGTDTGGSVESLTLRYRNKAPQTNTQGIEAQIELVNDGSTAVNYNGLEIRYFFAADGLTPEVSISRTSPSGAYLVASYASVTNSYAAFRVEGDLMIGAGQKLAFRFEITNTQNGQFNQSNDASYIASQTNMAETSVMVVIGADTGGTDTSGGTDTGGTDTGGTDTGGTDTGGTITVNPIIKNYEEVFSDEFDGSTLNPNKWNTALLWGPYLQINNEEQLYVDTLGMHKDAAYSPFELTGDTLKITVAAVSDTLEPPARPASDSVLWKPNSYSEYNKNFPTGTPGTAGYNPGYQTSDVNYLSGIITSYGSFKMTHGYVEMRAKLPAGQGLWPAFWMLPQHYVKDVPEIDVMEFLGQDVDRVYHTYHYFDVPNNWAKVSTPTYVTLAEDWTQDFHTFGMAWSPTEIVWYVDGKETRRITDSQFTIPNQAMHLLANVAVGGNWAGTPNGDTVFPAVFEIDYIRAYKKKLNPNLDLANDYQLMFGDDFNGSSLDSSKWNTRFLWGPNLLINSEEQYYVDALGSDAGGASPFSLSNGVLSITARKEDDPAGFPIPQEAEGSGEPLWADYDKAPAYTSGIITSYDAFKFANGYAEIRAKIPKGAGLWPAFWLLNGYYVGQQPEIDIMEVRGEIPSQIVHSYHYYENGLQSQSFNTDNPDTVDGYSDDFHTYGARWQPGRIDWYIDGVLKQSYESDKVGYQVMYVIANLAVGGNFNYSPTDTSLFPTRLDIDYIRVYQEKGIE